MHYIVWPLIIWLYLLILVATVVFTRLVVMLHGIKVVIVQLGVAKHVLRLALAALRLLVFCNQIQSTSRLQRVVRVAP